MTNLIGWLLIVGVLAGFAVPVATEKGRNTVVWVLLVLIFGPAAFWALTAMPVDNDELARRAIRFGQLKVCPACRETIDREATVCRHCRTGAVSPR